VALLAAAAAADRRPRLRRGSSVLVRVVFGRFVALLLAEFLSDFR